MIFKFLLVAITLLSCAKQSEAEPDLIIHYYRYNRDYKNWNIWAWPVDPPENAGVFEFDTDNPDEDGFVTAQIFFYTANDYREIGMIVRKSEEHNEWALKDGENDRFTREKEVWLVQHDPNVYTEKPPVTEPPILFAAADSRNTVMLTLFQETEECSRFSVYMDGKKLDGVSARDENNNSDVNKVIITLSNNIDDPSRLYTVRDESGVFAEKKVAMRRILDDFYYGGNDLGLTYKTGESIFKVWSPVAAEVSVALFDDAGAYNEAGKVADHENGTLYRMEKDAKTGVWSLVIKGNLEGKYYLYRVAFADGSITWAADPYAKAVSANGQRMAIIDLQKTNPNGWRQYDKPPFKAGAWQDAVLYELHVRDFSIDENSGMEHKGKFLAFTERGTVNKEGFATGVDHMVNLGITHVHLLPAFDFASINELAPAEYNWGYDPMHYNVPEGSYSTDPKNPSARINEFKQMVQALHKAGIRVVMDVVYNHTFHTGTWPFDAVVPGYYYRITDAGLYSNGSGCGNEVASDHPMVRKFIIDSCRYWASEYNIDGLRFDLMGLIDVGTMKQLTEEIRRDIDPEFIIYGEPWTGGASILEKDMQTVIGAQKGLGFAVFNDRLRTAVKGGSDDSSRGFATGGRVLWMEEGIVKGVMGSVNDFTHQANESINYVTAHDNLNLWDKVSLSHRAGDLAKNPYGLLEGIGGIFESEAVKSVLLANGIIFTSQGIPFFQAGDEMLRSKFGDHNSYISPDSINKIRWENAGLYREVIDYYAGLIKLRKEHPAFRQNTREDIEKNIKIMHTRDQCVLFAIDGRGSGDSWKTILVAYNGSRSEKTLDLPAEVPVWQQVVDSRRAGIETLAQISGSIELPPLSMAVLRE